MEIITFHSATAPEFHDWLDFPSRLYRDDPFYTAVQPPSASQHPEYLVVRENGKVLGRCATMLGHRITYQNVWVGLIGWYECEDGDDASMLLLNAAAQSLREHGCSFILGPLNGSTWHKYRLAKPGGTTFFLDLYHKGWYAKQFELAGFKPIEAYYSRRVPVGNEQVKLPAGYRIRKIDVNAFECELEILYNLSMEGFQESAYFTPIDFAEFLAMYAPIRQVVDPSLVLICENDAREPVGFLFGIPNYLGKPVESAIMKSAVVLPEHRSIGIYSALVNAFEAELRRLGLSDSIYALYRSGNPSALPARGGEIIRTYHLYGKALE